MKNHNEEKSVWGDESESTVKPSLSIAILVVSVLTLIATIAQLSKKEKTSYVLTTNKQDNRELLNGICQEGIELLGKDSCQKELHGSICSDFMIDEFRTGSNSILTVLDSYLTKDGCKVFAKDTYRGKSILRVFKVKLLSDTSYPFNYVWTDLSEIFSTNEDKERYSL